MKKRIYFMLILFINLLIYDQEFGLNALLIALLWIGLNYYQQPKPPNKKWGLAATLWLLAGLGNSLWYLDLGITLYFIAALNYFAVNYHSKITFPLSLIQSISSWATGFFRFFHFKIGDFNKTGAFTQQLIRKTLLFTLPVLVSIVFLKLYQAANPKFKEMTAFINLEFIEWPFFFTYLILMLVLFGFYFFKPSNAILNIDLNAATHVSPATHQFTLVDGKKPFEWQIGFILVSMLSLLLISFIVIDIQTIFYQEGGELSRSAAVHQGINILIVSIILVIIIVVLLYRGQNNFAPNSQLQYMTYGWLFLNAILIVLIAIKNYEYISDWGLTHKRIGVFIYLFLTLIGLALTATKIAFKTSVSHLLQTASTSFLATLVFYGLFNWNGMIAQYNLNEKNLSIEKVDLYYIANCGPETYLHLKNFIKAHDLSLNLEDDLLNYRVMNLAMPYRLGWKAIPSYKLSGYLTYKKLESPKENADNR